MKKIAAVICNYNKSDYVIQCIQSVLESCFTDFDLFVVDNASTDDSVKRIREEYGNRLQLFVNKENRGGSGGFNTGIRYAAEKAYEYIWCLDNDVLVDENAVGELYRFMESHPDVGMTGSKVYHMEAPDYVQQYGIDIIWDEYCCEAKYCNRPEDGTMPEIVYSDAVAACSVLVRTSLVKKIGMLPEENFLYWDDTEWGIRCNLAGYKVASLGASKVLHSMGAKKETVNTFPLYYSWRNWIRFFMKYTQKEKWEDMCTAFLEGIFDIVYGDLYLGEENRAKTLMYAYDDAIHNVTGKAEEYKIFPVVHSEDKLKGLLAGRKKINIYADGRMAQAEAFADKLKSIAGSAPSDLAVSIYEGSLGREKKKEKEAWNSQDECSFTMTDNIFVQNDLELRTFYVDTEGRILSSEEDVMMVINREYSRQLFLFSQKPLFMSKLDRAEH